MFKKTEDSEWSRFSRALSGQSKAGPEETQTREQPVVEPAPAQREVAPPLPTPPAPVAPPRPTPTAQQTYTRPAAASQHDTDEVETVIGLHSSFDGTLKCEASMRIRGAVQGEIACGKALFLEETARVNARITAANAVVAGKVEGSIECEGRLEVLATGQVSGELTAAVLIIQEGAFFEGHLKMKERKGDEKPAYEQPTPRRFGSLPADPS